ncbi:MAG: DUF4258 domain-containing protein [Bacteroidetes bacterium]|nr:DUF4258 domain-containing protein [Bacteroidota bacterium]
MKKAAPYLLLIPLALLVFFLRTCRNSNNPGTRDRNRNQPSAVDDVNRNRGFDRRTGYLEYTKHAQCRMECRHITQAEVQDIMAHGEINYRKSDVNAHPCPTYALEGYTQQDHQHVRIVFAQCDYKTKVVTCIDLDTDYECHCPGDGNKHEQ